jgi:ABC-type bacteriocin/lantibiotic exporter with double-glycine peptidase domain
MTFEFPPPPARPAVKTVIFKALYCYVLEMIVDKCINRRSFFALAFVSDVLIDVIVIPCFFEIPREHVIYHLKIYYSSSFKHPYVLEEAQE